jgi:hypothetical protein
MGQQTGTSTRLPSLPHCVIAWEHIALTGDYIWNGGNPGTDFRPLREVRTAFLPQVA